MSSLNLSRIFKNKRLRKEIPFQKNTEVKNADGDLVNILGDPEPVIVIIYPTSPDDMQLLEEGERHIPAQKVFSESPINVGDIFLYKGQMWRIAALGDWGDYGFHNGIGLLHEGTQEPFAKGFVLR